MNPYPLSEFGPLSLKFLLWMFLYWPLGFIYMYIMCCGVVRLAMFAQFIFTYYWSLKGRSSPVDLVVSTHIFYLVWLPCHQLFLTMMFRQNVKQLKIHALVKKWSNKDLTLTKCYCGNGEKNVWGKWWSSEYSYIFVTQQNSKFCWVCCQEMQPKVKMIRSCREKWSNERNEGKKKKKMDRIAIFYLNNTKEEISEIFPKA